MIAANELRIGNWVTGFDKHNSCGQILSIFDNQRRTDIKYNRPDIHLFGAFVGGFIGELKPISLTPEILEKAGFEYDSVCWYKGSIFLGDYKDGLFYLPFENIVLRGIEIKHLHQLQNFSFVLTGEELKIEL